MGACRCPELALENALDATAGSPFAATWEPTEAMRVAGPPEDAGGVAGSRDLGGPLPLRVFGLGEEISVLQFANALEARPEIDRLDLVSVGPTECVFRVRASNATRVLDALYGLREYRVAAVRSADGVEAHVQALVPADPVVGEDSPSFDADPTSGDDPLLPPPRRFRLGPPGDDHEPEVG